MLVHICYRRTFIAELITLQRLTVFVCLLVRTKLREGLRVSGLLRSVGW
jgi:hypothetical protein